MARRSSFSRSNSNSNARTASPRTAPRPSQPQQAPQAQSRPGIFGGLMGTMFQGMAFGAGSEVAHQAIRGVIGDNRHQSVDNTQQQEVSQNQTQSNPCTMENTNFVECLKFSSNDISGCQSYLDSLKQCEAKFK